MATARMQFRNDGFAIITNIGGVIEVSAPTWRAKRWATKQLKMKAAAFGISLKKRNGRGMLTSRKCKQQNTDCLKHLKSAG